MEHAMRALDGLSLLAAEGPGILAKEEKTATELEVMIEEKINRAARLRCHSRDVVRAVVRVHPDNEFGWRAQVITAPKSVEPFQIAAERTASDLRGLYDLKNRRRLDKVA